MTFVPIEPVKILLVDDLKDNLLALEGLLRRADVEICTAKSGSEALDLLLTNDFALALLDVQMPGMSGFELAELMRGAKKTREVPIIFVTATAEDQSFAFKGYESGAVDFLQKPLDTFIVKSKVSIFVELYRQKKELKNQLEQISSLVADLNRSKAEAETANLFKTQFLANMSHEIRTPLGAIMGFLDLIKDPDCTEIEKTNYGVIVERNSQQLLSLIDDILDLSKVEAGKMTTERVEFSLSNLLADFTSHMKFKAIEKGIEFRTEFTSLIPDLICSDPVRLRQVLGNVVGNAIKFTTRGVVELRVGYEAPDLILSVQDTGVGIDADQAAGLFQPFMQANAMTTRKFGGTGLGLVLSRRLAETMGGTLRLAQSAEGVGSTFVIQIQVGLSSKVQMITKEQLCLDSKKLKVEKLKSFSLKGLKILLVDDSPDNQILFQMYLGHEGAEVKSATDGADGVKQALAENFDVILMDIQMPILDGHKATRKLRDLQYAKPIIALTAHAMKEEREKCLQSGFTDFLTKPIRREQMIEVLAPYLPLVQNTP